MRYGTYIGRVGGLAVALGVGAGIAAIPWVAWAAPSDSTASSSEQSSGSTPEPSSTAESTSDSTSGDDPDAATPDSATADSGDEAVTEADADVDEEAGAPDQSDGAATSESQTPGAGADEITSAVNKKKKRGTVSAQAVPTSRDNADSQSTADSDLSADGFADLGTEAGDSTTQLTETQPLTSTPDLAAQGTVLTATQSQPVEPTSAPSTPTDATATVVSEVVSLAGLNPMAPTDPVAPVESPMAWAAMAVARRQFDSTASQTTAATVETSQSLAESQGFATLAVAADNSPPQTPGATQGAPDPATGAITGALNVTDPDGDAITYTVATVPTGGSLTLNPDGSFTYTPTQLTRLTAGSTLPADFDAFSVNASDGQATTNVPVSVEIYSGTLKPAGLDALGNLTPEGTIAVGAGPTAMATHENLIYVANTAGSTVAVLDTTTGDVLNTFGVGAGPAQLAVSPDGGTLYVANTTSNLVTVHDTSTGAAAAAVLVWAPYGLALDPAGTRLYVPSIVTNEVTVVDTATNATVATIPVGVTPIGVTVNSTGTRVYVANRSSGTVSTIDALTNTVVGTTPVGALPQQVALSADGTRLYVTNAGSGAVSVVDTNTFANVATVAVGPAPNAITLSRDGSLAYVVNGDNTISVIDTATNTKVTGTVHIETGPLGWVVAGPDGNTLYVSNSVGSTLRTMSLVHLADPPPVTGNPGTGPMFEDFTGPAGSVPNANLFSYVLGAGGGGELQAYTNFPRNASLDGNGNLVITAIKETVTDPFGGTWDYTSAALDTRDKLEFTYGTLSARVQFPAGQGLHPTFWTVGSDIDQVGWPNSGEVDILEMFNSATGSVLHGPGHYGVSAPAQVDVSDGQFHTVWMTWEPNKITTGIDGTTTAVFTPDSLPPGTPWTFNDRSMYAILSLAVGGSEGPPDETVLPASIVVDWISYEPLPGDTGSAPTISV